MLAFGGQLAHAIRGAGVVIYLRGELGAGKTTLTRGLLQSLGVMGKVKSPTYTLVETYELGSVTAYHFDLYRLADPEELEYMGIRDYSSDDSIIIVEWPERGAGHLAPADLIIHIHYHQTQRRLSVQAASVRGTAVVSQLTST